MNYSFFLTGFRRGRGIIAFSNWKTALPNFSSPAFLTGLLPEAGIISFSNRTFTTPLNSFRNTIVEFFSLFEVCTCTVATVTTSLVQ